MILHAWHTEVETVEPPRAIAVRFDRHAHPVEQGQVEIGQRRLVGIPDMTSGINASTTTTGKENWQIFVVVLVAVTDPASVHNHAVVQQRPVALADRL